jgi:uncharacterized damage-inducible protein DinB
VTSPPLDGAALVGWIRAILRRDLATLRRELDLYADDTGPWRPVPGLANAGGTLALHLAGNLRHFVGARLGGSGYVRDRASEFAERDVPRAKLIALVDAAMLEVDAALARLDPARLTEPYPEAVAGVHVVTGDLLLHLAVHLTYHLGQLNAHRRVVSGDPSSVGALAVRVLATAHPTEAP